MAYVLLSLLHTYPLVRHLDTHLPGQGLGDNVSFVWNLWWMRQALASPLYDFFNSPLVLAPLGGSLVLHTHTALSGLLAATLLAPLPVVTAQNVLLIASLALNGLAAYTLALVVTKRRGASFAAGALFVAAPAVTARLMGHYNLVVAWPLVFACAALAAWWQVPGLRRGVAVALTVAAIAYADYYYAVFFALFALLYSATEMIDAHLTAARRADHRWSVVLAALAVAAFAVAIAIAVSRPAELRLVGVRISLRSPTNALTVAWLLTSAAVLCRWRPSFTWLRRPGAVARPAPRHAAILLGVVVLLFVALATPLATSAWRLWRSGDYVTQSSSLRSSPRGVDAATVVLGPPFSGVFGASVRETYHRFDIDAIEGSAWVGVTMLLFIVIAVRQRHADRELRRWLLIGAAFAVWALGPFLVVLGGNSGLLLPQALARLVPVLNNARIPGRAMVMAGLAGAVLAGLLLARAATAPPGRSPRRAWLWLAVVAALAESVAAPLPLAALPDAGVYRDLARDATPGAVLTIPFGVRDGFGEKGFVEPDGIYQQTLHGRPLVGGFLARIPPRVWTWYEATEPYRTLLALSSGETVATPPACAVAREGLRRAGVAFVVLYRDAAADDAGEPLKAFVQRRLPLREVSRDAGRTLYALKTGNDACATAP